MAVDLFKLVGSVFIDTDKANESLQKTDKKASSFASTLGTVASGALKFGGMVVGAASAIGGAAMGVADKVSKQTDEIDKASIRMGISAEAYQELAYAAGQCGVEMSTMEQAAKKLEGTDLNFEDAIDQIMSLGTAEERSAKAAELFGEKIAYNLSPLIEQSGEDFEGLIQRANDLGLVMSGDAVKNGVAFGDMLSDIKQMVGSLATQIGTALFPIANALFEQIIDFMPTIQGFMSQLVPYIVKIVENLLPVLFQVIEALLPVIMEIADKVLPVAMDLLMALLPLITALIPLIEPLSELLLAVLDPCLQFIDAVLPPIIESLTSMISGVIPGVSEALRLVAGSIKDILNTILNFVKPFIQTFIDLFKGIGKFLTGVFTGDWKMAWEGILDVMKSYVNGLIRALEAFINLFVDTINTVINAAKRLASLIPGVDLNTDAGAIPRVEIPKLAKGGIITGEGQAIVGEAGAELLTLPKGATVQPLNNGIDYEKLTDAFITALRVVAPELSANVRVEGNRDNLVRVMVGANREAVNMYGKGLFE